MSGLEKQRDYLMRKLQQTKSNLESEKFAQLKEYEMDKLEMLKKIEELLRLNDILVGSKRIFDGEGNPVDTIEVMSILNPATDSRFPCRNLTQDSSRKLTVRDIIEKLKKRFIPCEDKSVQAREDKSTRGESNWQS